MGTSYIIHGDCEAILAATFLFGNFEYANLLMQEYGKSFGLGLDHA